MAGHNRNHEFKKSPSFIDLPSIWHDHLKSDERKKSFTILILWPGLRPPTMPQFVMEAYYVSFEVLTNLFILIFQRCHAPTRLYNFFFMYQSYACDLRIPKSRQHRQYTYNATLGRIRATTAAVEKQKALRILSVGLLAYVWSMQRTSAILSSVASSATQYSSTLSHKRHDIRHTSTEHKMCVLIFSTKSV